ncbi:MAG: hypothetical protein ACTIK8_01600, partial [Microbacterium gubbeenense]
EWTEETAYAEAEEVFRAYWDATFEAEVPDDLLTEEMADEHAKGVTQIAESGLETRGAASIVAVHLSGFRHVSETVVVDLEACIDGATFEVRTDGGDWMQPRDDPKYGVEAQLESRDGEMLVAGLTEPETSEC